MYLVFVSVFHEPQKTIKSNLKIDSSTPSSSNNGDLTEFEKNKDQSELRSQSSRPSKVPVSTKLLETVVSRLKEAHPIPLLPTSDDLSKFYEVENHSKTHASQSPQLSSASISEKIVKPVILLWIPPFHWPTHWILPDTPLCGGGCDITMDRSRLDESSAVVFYMKATNSKDLPPRRRQDQLFIWWCHESPWTVNHIQAKLFRAKV